MMMMTKMMMMDLWKQNDEEQVVIHLKRPSRYSYELFSMHYATMNYALCNKC